jgi:NDP-sugar pyrophosphorylase family protein
MVGGRGSRLLPYTKTRPKALMKLGEYSVLEIIVRQLQLAGCQKITLCILHFGEAIKQRFGDGTEFGVQIEYCMEAQPRGTAGPLLLLEDWDAPALIVNGDVLTNIDFADMYRAHVQGDSRLTVASKRCDISVDFGALQIQDGIVSGIVEKPSIAMDICLGVYVADPAVREFLPRAAPADMPDLITALLKDNRRVQVYSFSGRWHDIGTPASYEQAGQDFLENRELYLPAANSRPLAAVNERRREN